MRNWNETYRARLSTAEEAAKLVSSGDRVYSHMGAAHPLALLDALCDRAAELRGVEILHCITIGEARYTQPEFAGTFRHNSLFTAANTRQAVQSGRAGTSRSFCTKSRIFLKTALSRSMSRSSRSRRQTATV